MDISHLNELQDEIVLMSAHAIDGKWDAAVVNVEAELIEDAITLDAIALYFVKAGDSWAKYNFSLFTGAPGVGDLIRNFWRESPGEKWSSFTLEFLPSGRYRFGYGFGTPSRSNGVFDDASYLNGYQPKW